MGARGDEVFVEMTQRRIGGGALLHQPKDYMDFVACTCSEFVSQKLYGLVGFL